MPPLALFIVQSAAKLHYFAFYSRNKKIRLIHVKLIESTGFEWWFTAWLSCSIG